MNNIIDEKIKKRFQFLNALYEFTGGSRLINISYSELGEKIGLTNEESDQISDFLSDEKLIEFVAFGGQMSITHKGILEIEKALSKPQEPTEYFPAINIFIMGNVSGSNILAGNNNQVQAKGNQHDRTMDAKQ